MPHPYADLIGLRLTEQGPGVSLYALTVEDKHLESQLFVAETPVASASGNFSIFTPTTRASG